jgi:BirA family biotin operon repressor/biotin-[acetyl-CoA-carboxylase] ligase
LQYPGFFAQQNRQVSGGFPLTTRDFILDALRRSNGGPVSGEDLAKQCGLSRAAIWKSVNVLRKNGYPVIGATKTGYMLDSECDILSEGEIFQAYAALLPNHEVRSPLPDNYRAVTDAIADIAQGAETATAKHIRPDLAHYGGNGDVTFIWRDEKKGLYHIGYRRGAEAVRKVIHAVLEGEVTRFVPSAKTITLTYTDYEAFLSLDLYGKPHTWLLTGWKINGPGAIGQPFSKPNATQVRPTFSRSDLGAGTYTIMPEIEKKSSQQGITREKIHVFDEIDSTNTCAKKCAVEAGPLRDGTGSLTAAGQRLHCSVYIADTQTAGRGRMGRAFYSPKGSGLYLSLLYCPETCVRNPARFTAAAAVAVCASLEGLYGVECRIKWVNDIFVNGKKVCGILSEGVSNFETGQVESVVVGIGVNVREAKEGFPGEIQRIAGSVLGKKGAVNRNQLAAEIVVRLLELFEGADILAMMREYRRRSLTLGSEIIVYPVAGDKASSFRARAVGITDEAELVVETDSGERRTLKAGEVSHRAQPASDER